MNVRFRARTGSRRKSRIFSAYLVLVLVTAIIGPGLAVHAAEGEPVVLPEAPVAEFTPPVGAAPVTLAPAESVPADLASDRGSGEGAVSAPAADDGDEAADAGNAAPEAPAFSETTNGEVEQVEPETGAVLVHKFQDCNLNGVRDENEPLLAGWYFSVCSSEGVLLGAGYTDDQGMILFDGLPEGDVCVAETLQPGWNNTTPLRQSVTVTPGETTHVYFGNARCPQPETGSLIIRKYEDLDEDCRWDQGEPALEGWFFTVCDAQGVELGSGYTDANGWLMFDGLPEGQVTAVETLQPGWNNTTPLGQEVMIVGGASSHLCFGNVRCVEAPETGELVVRKYEDLDEDGRWDESEPVLGGWRFTVYDAQGAQLDTGLTDANGWLLFTGLAAGEVTVVETLQPGWTNTTPLSQDTTIVGGQRVVLYFGNVGEAAAPTTGDVLVHKFLDLNENGRQDNGETFLAGWAFVVRDGAGAAVASGSTNSAGEVSFELAPGTYSVTETLIAGWTNTTPLTQSFTIVAGQTQHVFFGNAQESFLPFTPAPETDDGGGDGDPADPFLPFTGGEYWMLTTAALASGVAGLALRRRQRD